MLEYDLEIEPGGAACVRVRCASCGRLHREEELTVDVEREEARVRVLEGAVAAFREDHPEGHECPVCGETSTVGTPFGWDPPLLSASADG